MDRISKDLKITIFAFRAQVGISALEWHFKTLVHFVFDQQVTTTKVFLKNVKKSKVIYYG